MEKLICWLRESFEPKVRKVSNNIWIATLQSSVLKVMPLIMVGSLTTLGYLITLAWDKFPDLTMVNNFTFGIISLIMSCLVPYTYLEKKGYHKVKFVGLFTGLGLFLIALRPEFTDAGAVFDFNLFGASGMFVAIFTGIIVGAIMGVFAKFSFFKADSATPDFIKIWFDSIIPVAFIITAGWITVFVLDFDIVQTVNAAISPLAKFAETGIGFVTLRTLDPIIYSMGISPWILSSVTTPIQLSSIATNASVAAAGGIPTLIMTMESKDAGWYCLGGIGSTLPLVIYMCFLARSAKYKAVGRASIVPGIMNINEPLVFGAVAWNPILMIPMILNTLITSSITYIALRTGIVPIPSHVMDLWYVPYPIQTWLCSPHVSSIILLLITAFISCLIWYPFFKIADKQQIEEEKKLADEPQTEW